jgi:GH25 family lysozyme M1 (1,4-beta-N-acetylmuramidase)
MRLAARAALPALLALLLVTIIPIDAGVADASTSRWTTNCSVNVRSRPLVGATRRIRIAPGTAVTVSRKVTGGWYSTTCKTAVSGRYWFAITAIGGRSVKSIFGITTIYAASALFHSSSTGYIYGVDVSQWQGKINFDRVAASGRQFVIARATAGRFTTDKTYARNRKLALAAGLAFTAYHYANPDRTRGDATMEADRFLAVAKLKHGMLVPALDLEVGSRLGTVRLQRWVRTWLQRVHSKTGVKPMIYTTQVFWHDYMGDSTWFARNGYHVLWVAHWDASRPSVPARKWDGSSWTIWQYSDCGKVPGIAHCVDLDRFRGSDLDAIRW